MADSAASSSDGNPRAAKRPNTGSPAGQEQKQSESSSDGRKRAQPEDPFSSPTDTDIVDLNVGGEMKTVLRSTLRRYEDSMMAVMFAPSKAWSFARKDGVIFLDRDPKAFDVVLRFLRTGYVDYTGDEGWDAAINAELEYWGLLMPEPEAADKTPSRAARKYERTTTYTIPTPYGGVIEFSGIAGTDLVDDLVDRCAALFDSQWWPEYPTHEDCDKFTNQVVACMPKSVHFCDVHFYQSGKPSHNTPRGMESKIIYFNLNKNTKKTRAFMRIVLK